MIRTEGTPTVAHRGTEIDFSLCADVRVVDVGSLWLVTPLSTEGRNWVEENVSDDSTWWGSSLVVEPRYVVDLCDGMLDDGLVLCGRDEERALRRSEAI